MPTQRDCTSRARSQARSAEGAWAQKSPTKQLVSLLLDRDVLAHFRSSGRGRHPSAKGRSWIHMMIFAGALTFTLYVVTDMEFPRLGLITVESFDHFLVDVHEQMR
jgi:hypothetical protein